MINLIHVTKSFNRVQILKDIDLELPNTGLISILGESGSGKSTLLNILGGLDNPSSGEILYDGIKIKDMDSYREKNISYIFLDCFLLENNTVYDNLYEYLLLNGITSKEEVDFRIHQVLDIVKLKKYKRHFVKNLSGGERQRVGIARALLRKNKILFADEPTGNLDQNNARVIMSALKYAAKDALVLLVTHNKILAEDYSDKIYTIQDGRILKEYIPLNKGYDSSNRIYEEDLKHSEISKEDVKIDTYDLDSLKISFYSIHGQIYYKTDQKIKNIEDSPYIIAKERKDAIPKENIDISIEYNDVEKKNNRFKEILLYFFNKTKLNLVHRIFLALIGIMLFFFSFFLVSSTKVDESKVRYTDTAYLVNRNIHNDGKGKYLDSTSLEELILENKITDVVEEAIYDFYLFHNSYVKSKSEKGIYVPIEYNNKEALYGVNQLNNSDEVIISKALANSIKGDISLNNLLNYSLNINGTKTNKRIVGITDSLNYEVFYYKTYDYSVGLTNYSIDGSLRNVRIVSNFTSFDLSLSRGELPKNKKEILALDDGKTELGAKAGEYLISGFYELDDSIENKYEYIISLDSTEFRLEYNLIHRMFNLKLTKNYLFQLHTENIYKNVCMEKDYQYDAFYGESHERLVSFIIPAFSILFLITGYVILMSFIMVNKMANRLAFERTLGKKRFYLSFKVFVSSIMNALIFVGIPYILSSFFLLGLLELNKTFNIGLPILNPYSSIWFYLCFLISVLAYGVIYMLSTVLKLRLNISSLLKRIKS